MPTETIQLSESQAEFLRTMVESGEYEDTSEAVRAALRFFEEHRKEYAAHVETLRAELQKGIDDYEAGRYIELNDRAEIDALGDEITRSGLERLAGNIDGPPTSSD